MQKRGLSDVVTSVLIILLAIVSVAIIWVVVQSFLKSSGEQMELGTFTAQLDVVPGSVKAVSLESAVDVSLLVKRGSEGEDISAFNVIVEDSTGVSKISKYTPTTALKDFETTRVSAHFDGLKDASKISIVPIINRGGKEFAGRLALAYKPQTGEVFKMPEGLVGYWKFDEISWSGTTYDVLDSSGKGLNGKAEGGAEIRTTTSVSGNSGYFDGVNDNINLGTTTTSIDLGTTKAGTLIAWVKPDSQTTSKGNVKNVIGGYSPMTNGKGYIMGLSDGSAPQNRIAVLIDSYGGWRYSAQSVEVNKWSMIAASFDANGFKIYRNGVIDITISISGSVGSYTDVRRIGASAYKYNPDYFYGNIDEVMIFNKKLEDADIKKIYDYFSPSIKP